MYISFDDGAHWQTFFQNMPQIPINDIKIHRKDHSSRRGLLKMVGNRNSLLKYVKNTDIQRYRTIITRLGLRK